MIAIVINGVGVDIQKWPFKTSNSTFNLQQTKSDNMRHKKTWQLEYESLSAEFLCSNP